MRFYINYPLGFKNWHTVAAYEDGGAGRKSCRDPWLPDSRKTFYYFFLPSFLRRISAMFSIG